MCNEDLCAHYCWLTKSSIFENIHSSTSLNELVFCFVFCNILPFRTITSAFSHLGSRWCQCANKDDDLLLMFCCNTLRIDQRPVSKKWLKPIVGKSLGMMCFIQTVECFHTASTLESKGNLFGWCSEDLMILAFN